MNTIMDLHNDNILDIILFLDIKSYLRFKQTCKWIHSLKISRIIQKIDAEYQIEYRFLHKLHRDDDQPAVIRNSGSKEWYQYGKLHRDNDQPAIVWASGSQCWFQHGELHRDEKPAAIYVCGQQYWYQGGKFIRFGVLAALKVPT